jgi:cysteinyl-tRNA synthetase
MQTPYPVKLYNTLSKSLEELSPVTAGQVGLYCCGPTVYDTQHIGNFKTFIFEDVLVRALRFAGYTVKHVMNITDVGHLTGDNDEGEDKMLVAARREKKNSHEIAEYYTQKFFTDWDRLNLHRPSVVCKATEHITDMIELIKRIEKRRYAYLAGGNVYFDVGKFKAYGKLANLNVRKLKAGARVRVDANKRNPYDFALWFTKSKFEDQEMQWDSPWGRGYPGWHIECSAMSMKYLGEEFDIHCGGIDHIPVHHTNEIAQSEAATGKRWVRIWLHSEFMLLNDEKMSKSKGGFLTLDDLTAKGFEPAAYRMLLLGAQYRAHLSFSWEALDNAKRNLERLRGAVLALRAQAPAPAQSGAEMYQQYLQDFRGSILNDLNTPQALAVMWRVVTDKSLTPGEKLALLFEIDSVLGLGMETWTEQSEEIPAEVQQLAAQREEARRSRDWAGADRLRDQIAALGYRMEDSAQGPKIKKE